MVIYSFDGTIIGIFTCIFESFMSDEIPYSLSDKPVQASFCDDIRYVKTDEKKSSRVIRAFVKYAGKSTLHDLYYAFRSDEKNKNTVIFNFIRKTIIRRDNITEDFSCPEVMDFYDLIKRIGNEIHRMKGFLRFSMANNGVYYAHFSPDNNITDLLLPHFTQRLGNQPFAIHDTKRNVIAMYDGRERKLVKLNSTLEVTLNNGEENFTALWQTYYEKVNISERENKRQMLNNMQARYHRHLPEKQLKIKVI